ncbi:hypothetical protein [Streptomyces sp. AK02-01A]|uniref:hypothetical protein n=1 Tax=Streptomyces sp. AK02-01A TaxID=3028648 RepID=UPI0029A2C839|nr:hypothetical protein [Streptomyces sp. AK02-01A]MDX3855263.1 hypothetical protein [Streptomyces sp. AK02-01A]
MTHDRDQHASAAHRAPPVRTIEVIAVIRITSHMAQITFGGPGLAAGPVGAVGLARRRARDVRTVGVLRHARTGRPDRLDAVGRGSP